MNVIPMQLVVTEMAHTTAPVFMVTVEMDSIAQVSHLVL